MKTNDHRRFLYEFIFLLLYFVHSLNSLEQRVQKHSIYDDIKLIPKSEYKVNFSSDLIAYHGETKKKKTG